MLTFFADCVGLFDSVFDAMWLVAFFRFLVCFWVVSLSVAFFHLLRRGLSRK